MLLSWNKRLTPSVTIVEGNRSLTEQNVSKNMKRYFVLLNLKVHEFICLVQSCMH